MNEFMPFKLKPNNTEKELHTIKLRLQQLEGEKQQLLQRQDALNALKARNKPEANQFSTDQKVHLFQEIFKGRTDIFAKRCISVPLSAVPLELTWQQAH